MEPEAPPAQGDWWEAAQGKVPRAGSSLPDLVDDLLDVARALHASLDLPATLDSVVRHMSRACGFQVASFNALDGEVYRAAPCSERR